MLPKPGLRPARSSQPKPRRARRRLGATNSEVTAEEEIVLLETIAIALAANEIGFDLVLFIIGQVRNRICSLCGEDRARSPRTRTTPRTEARLHRSQSVEELNATDHHKTGKPQAV